MKKFIIKIIFFILMFFSVVLIFHGLIKIKNVLEYDSSSIYVFGDSQSYRGIKINDIKSSNILSSSEHGAGVYDFLNFTLRVPSKSAVLIPLSETILLRQKNLDRNESGLHIRSMIFLLKNGYDLREIMIIISKSLIPRLKWFNNHHETYNCNQKIIYQQKSIIENIYNSPLPRYFDDKLKLYLLGISILNKKNCHINFIRFPFHTELELIRNKSTFLNHLNKSFESIISKGKIVSMDTLKLSSSLNNFYDWTHLNECGANQVTEFISSKISLESSTSLIISK